MWLQDLLLLLLLASSVFLIGIPTAKLIKAVVPRSRPDPLVEAKKRLEQAKLEAEAARLNKETEKLYNKMIEDVIQDDDDNYSTDSRIRRNLNENKE